MLLTENYTYEEPVILEINHVMKGHLFNAIILFYKNCCTLFVRGIFFWNWSEILQAVIKAYSKTMSGVCLITAAIDTRDLTSIPKWNCLVEHLRSYFHSQVMVLKWKRPYSHMMVFKRGETSSDSKKVAKRRRLVEYKCVSFD